MKYKLLKFWVTLDKNLQFTPAVDFFEKLIIIFVYFRYRITILQCLQKKPELFICTAKEFSVKNSFVYLCCIIMLKKILKADHET